ncbi:FRG domain-containing protein [Streptococcus sp. S784/96/1]|uniref:FRG domain-containing protein n=1 Tax=Streptococcus sp. S784/96/1 TaxID=2653499 RepID=UPI0013869358|nr:FRG domain-containing protein [Streptococcus sp. S784/96/1]
MENNLDKPIKIKSVTEFLELIIKGIEQEQEEFNFYYRGEASGYDWRTPNLYREKKLVNEGSEYYYRSLLNELGKVDYENGSSLFQLLSELQHYEAKTRMLDITTNPLVSLYFAVELSNKEDENKNGHVYLFKEEKRQEKFDTGHTVALKSALNLMPQESIDHFLTIMTKIINYLGDRDDLPRYQDGQSDYFKYTSFSELANLAYLWSDFVEFNTQDREFYIFRDTRLSDLISYEGNERFYEYIMDNKYENDEYELDIKKALVKKIEDFLELLNQRAKTKEILKYPVRIYEDLLDSHIVLSSKRTDRLRQQQGAFIYPRFPSVNDVSFDKIKEVIHDSIMEKSATLEYQGENYTHIIIPENKKESIRKELALIGIDEGFIYPDIKHRSNALLK